MSCNDMGKSAYLNNMCFFTSITYRAVLYIEMGGIVGSLEGVPIASSGLIWLDRLIPTTFLFFSLLKLAASRIGLHEGYRAQLTL